MFAQLEQTIKAFCAELDPEAIPLREVPAVYACLAAMEKAIAGARTRMARRVDECQVWKRDGAADAAEWMARTAGTSIGAARDTLTTSKRVSRCPDVDAALAAGRLSGPQAHAIADAAAVSPADAGSLLDTAAASSLAELRDECARTKARATDPAETERRIHARRSARDYTDGEGAWHFHATGTAADGSKVRAVLAPIVEERFAAARRDGDREPREAYAFDAFVELAGRAAGDTQTTRPNPKHLGLIRVDHAALVRGAVEGDELCEIAGVGPVSVPAARELLGPGILKLVITRGTAVANVTHLGRGLNVAQQVAQWWLLPACTTLGCPRRARLENDHRVPYADTHVTTLEGNDPLCTDCHRRKTHQGWALIAGTAKRAMVAPDDPRHPNNANAPPDETAA